MTAIFRSTFIYFRCGVTFRSWQNNGKNFVVDEEKSFEIISIKIIMGKRLKLGKLGNVGRRNITMCRCFSQIGAKWNGCDRNAEFVKETLPVLCIFTIETHIAASNRKVAADFNFFRGKCRCFGNYSKLCADSSGRRGGLVSRRASMAFNPGIPVYEISILHRGK